LGGYISVKEEEEEEVLQLHHLDGRFLIFAEAA